MKRGEQVVVKRLQSGLYAIKRVGQPTLVGGAASTAVALNTLVFVTEAGEVPQHIEKAV